MEFRSRDGKRIKWVTQDESQSPPVFLQWPITDAAEKMQEQEKEPSLIDFSSIQ